jgi:biotin carboxyl carrier protein
MFWRLLWSVLTPQLLRLSKCVSGGGSARVQLSALTPAACQAARAAAAAAAAAAEAPEAPPADGVLSAAALAATILALAATSALAFRRTSAGAEQRQQQVRSPLQGRVGFFSRPVVNLNINDSCECFTLHTRRMYALRWWRAPVAHTIALAAVSALASRRPWACAKQCQGQMRAPCTLYCFFRRSKRS